MAINKKPIRVALYGMDARTQKTMVMFLQGPCKGIASVVDELDAEIYLIDVDYIRAKDILDEKLSKMPKIPIILLSLDQLTIEGTFYVKKPIQITDLISALNKAYSVTYQETAKVENTLSDISNDSESNKTESFIKDKQIVKKNIDLEEIKKTSKHKTATDLTETNLSAYIGHIEGIDFSNHDQLQQASYNPQNFFLGYVQSAYKVGRKKARILQLDSGWKPLIIFPHSHEVWLDADDKQLRAFSGLAIKKNSGQKMSLSSLKLDSAVLAKKMENFHDMDAFIWKLAIWTSKGRYPHTLDINRPVYLKRWPNFTRLVITPHAMRISALLIKGPRSLSDIADCLKINPQYVFVFISAANILGLVGQSERNADEIIAPTKIPESKSKSLLSKILTRLRA